ncbi:MAG: chorismate mutase [Gemmatimonadetes bacterium]|nr:chorismate mutase [Gemmatimonadota bacterium]
MGVRGIRGATVVEADERELILEATKELLEALVQENDVAVEDIASLMFTMTPDLRSVYPAQAARWLGWKHTPVLGATETDVPGGLPRCIRILMHVNTDRVAADIKHVYLHAAQTLYPEA